MKIIKISVEEEVSRDFKFPYRKHLKYGMLTFHNLTASATDFYRKT